jgi:hypothetical protein
VTKTAKKRALEEDKKKKPAVSLLKNLDLK